MLSKKTIINTDKVYSGRLLSVVVHDICLPDRSHCLQEVLHHPGAIALVPLNDSLNVLLVRQYRIPMQKILWELPAGTLERDEEPDECAIRELQEETGYKPGKLEYLGGFYSAPGYNTEFIHLFLATNLSESKLEADADELIEICWVPLTDAIRMVEFGEIVDAKTVAGLLRVARRLQM